MKTKQTKREKFINMVGTDYSPEVAAAFNQIAEGQPDEKLAYLLDTVLTKNSKTQPKFLLHGNMNANSPGQLPMDFDPKKLHHLRQQ